MNTKTCIALAALLAFGQGAWAEDKDPIGSITWNKEKSYYEIDSFDDLNDLAVYVNGEGTYSTGVEETTAHKCEGLTFMVMKDITFNGPVSPETSNFTPIGIVELDEATNTPLYDKCFEGVFDGNGKTISGVTVNNPSGEAIALFGNVGYPGIIKNVILANSHFTGNYCVGGIVAEYTTSSNESEYGIFDCEVSADVIVSAVTFGEGEEALPGCYAGGIVGMAGLTTVSGCVSSATVSGDEYVGGITGQIYKDSESLSGTLSECYYIGSSVSGADGAQYVGNIVGLNGREDDYSNFVAGSDITLAISLLDDDSEANIRNADRLDCYDGIKNVDVTLSGRTLYKDGKWNTLCLPFALNSFSGTPLDGATVKTLGETSFYDGSLELTFVDATIEAGKPYIFKASGSDIEGPTFKGVTISNATTPVEKDYVDFVGTFSPIDIFTEDKTNLYLAADNLLYYPSGEDMTSFTINSFRAYFQLKGGLTAGELPTTEGQEGQNINAFVLNFGEETGIREISKESRSC